MFLKLIITCFLLVILNQCFAQKKDTILLYNNAVLIGALKKVQLGKFTFDADGIGLVHIKNEKIKSLTATTELYRIGTISTDFLYGVIKKDSVDGTVNIVTKSSTINVKVLEIVSLSLFGRNLSSKIYGDISAGYTFTKSSEIGRFNLASNLTYANKKTILELEANSIITSDSISTYRERELLRLNCSYYFNKKWFSGAFVKYQRNLQLGIKLRLQQGVGMGYNFIQTSLFSGSCVSGLALNQEENIDASRNNSLEWTTQLKNNLFSFSYPNITIGTIHSFYVSLSQNGRYRIDGDIKVSWEIISDFTINCTFYHNYDKISPISKTSKSDYGFITSLQYSF